jgi:adenine deaminase
VRLALGAGAPPADAYRMVTLNPEIYYGRDADLGGIAPGRYADLLLLRDLAEPVPDVVIARGRVAAREGRLLACLPEPVWLAVFTLLFMTADFLPSVRLTAGGVWDVKRRRVLRPSRRRARP